MYGSYVVGISSSAITISCSLISGKSMYVSQAVSLGINLHIMMKMMKMMIMMIPLLFNCLHLSHLAWSRVKICLMKPSMYLLERSRTKYLSFTMFR